jgi:hypothetical protein
MYSPLNFACFAGNSFSLRFAGPFQEAKAGAFAYGADAQERVFNLPR